MIDREMRMPHAHHQRARLKWRRILSTQKHTERDCWTATLGTHARRLLKKYIYRQAKISGRIVDAYEIYVWRDGVAFLIPPPRFLAPWVFSGWYSLWWLRHAYRFGHSAFDFWISYAAANFSHCISRKLFLRISLIAHGLAMMADISKKVSRHFLVTTGRCWIDARRGHFDESLRSSEQDKYRRNRLSESSDANISLARRAVHAEEAQVLVNLMTALMKLVVYSNAELASRIFIKYEELRAPMAVAATVSRNTTGRPLFDDAKEIMTLYRYFRRFREWRARFI